MQEPTEDVLLNEGLAFAMEWGENWLKPIQERLGQIHPYLSPARLNEINKICQRAMRFGIDSVYAIALKGKKAPQSEEFMVAFKTCYPWANAENVSTLFSQGMYYLWKDGGPTY